MGIKGPVFLYDTTSISFEISVYVTVWDIKCLSSPCEQVK